MFQIVFFVSWGALVGRRGGENYGDHCAPAPPNFNVGRRGVLALAALAGVLLLCSVGTTREKIVRRLNIEIGRSRGERGSAANHRTKSCVASCRRCPSMWVPFGKSFPLISSEPWTPPEHVSLVWTNQKRQRFRITSTRCKDAPPALRQPWGMLRTRSTYSQRVLAETVVIRRAGAAAAQIQSFCIGGWTAKNLATMTRTQPLRQNCYGCMRAINSELTDN